MKHLTEKYKNPNYTFITSVVGVLLHATCETVCGLLRTGIYGKQNTELTAPDCFLWVHSESYFLPGCTEAGTYLSSGQWDICGSNAYHC